MLNGIRFGSIFVVFCLFIGVFSAIVSSCIHKHGPSQTWSAVRSGYHRIQSECQTCSKSVIHRVPTRSDGVWSAIFDETGTLSWEDSDENYKFNLDTPTSLPWAPMSPSIYETKSIPKSHGNRLLLHIQYHPRSDLVLDPSGAQAIDDIPYWWNRTKIPFMLGKVRVAA